MVKKILSIMLTLMLVASAATIATTSASADEEETYTYYFLAPEIFFNTNSSIGLYYWAPSEKAPWPGTEITEEAGLDCELESGEKVFKVEVAQNASDTADAAVTTPTIIFNSFVDGAVDPDNAFQTVDISAEGFYEGTNVMLEDGSFTYGEDETKFPRYTENVETTNFDGMIYVPTDFEKTINAFGNEVVKATGGCWYYYWGNGKYGVTPEEPKEDEPSDVDPIEDVSDIEAVSETDTTADTPADATADDGKKSDTPVSPATGDTTGVVALGLVLAAAAAVVVFSRKRA